MVEQLLSLFFFIPAIFVAFYIPGRVILGMQEDIKGLALIICSFIIGLVLWGWQGYILGYVNLRFLSYVYLFAFLSFFFKYKYHNFSLRWPKNIDFLAIFMIIVGTVGQTVPFYNSGIRAHEGIIISIFNAPDHIWHTSLVNEMVHRFPPYEPGMYGILVTNYHYWFNLVTAELIRVFHLPLFQTQYIGMYIFGSVMLGITAYVFSTSILRSRAFVRWLLFFLYFGGDASYWLSFITTRTFNFTIPSIIEDASIFMDNPPRAFSIIILFIALYLLFIKLNNLRTKDIIIIGLLAGTLIGFKVYTGIFLLSGLGLLALYTLLAKRSLRFVALFIFTLCLSVIIFVPVNAHSGGMFFNPFDRPRDFITYHPLGLNDLELRWVTYKEHNNYLRLTQYGIIMTIIYLFAQFGIRLIGIIPYRKMFSVLNTEEKIIMYGSMFSIFFIGLLFSQVAHASDSFNFFVSGGFFLTILTALMLAIFLEKKHPVFRYIAIFLIVGVTIPRWVYAEATYVIPYVLQGSFYGITNEELEAFTFLRENTDQNSIILVLNKGYLDQHSAVISTFTNKYMFLSGKGVIGAHNAENPQRVAAVEIIQTTKDIKLFMKTVNKYAISYLYLYKNNKIKVPEKEIEKYKVFQNSTVVIYKISDK